MNQPNPDPALQEIAERDRSTVMGCDHGAIELDQSTLDYPNGPVQVDVMTCVTCPTHIVVSNAADPRDDVYAGKPLGN